METRPGAQLSVRLVLAMRLQTTATFAGVTAENIAPDFEQRLSLVYRLPGGELLHFPPDQDRSVATLVKNAPRTLVITAEEAIS